MLTVTALEGALSEAKSLLADRDVHIGQVDSLIKHYQRVPPIPPKHLQVRVSGNYYPDFFNHGRRMLNDIDGALASQGLALSRFERILDFGCGCGRFLIPLSLSMDPSRLYGCDIDEEAIGWFSGQYPHIADLYTGPHNPKTKYADDSFDFLYSVSIFTHLPEDMQFAWLEELRRITRKNSWLVLTTHGAKFTNEMPPKYHQSFNERGFHYLGEAGLTPGLPTFYRGAYHLHHYIEREWSKYFRVAALIDKGLDGHQDIIVLQNVK